jgi:carboxypeptidase Taq
LNSADAAERLFALWREIRHLDAVEALLSWDQETCMPAAGVQGRAAALATLAGLRHERLVAPELGGCLEECAGSGDAELEAQVERARWRVDRAVRVPVGLARDLAETSSLALAAWQEARRRSDFALFRPLLERMIELKRREAEAIAPAGRPYDVLLDEHEPGASESQLAPLFRELVGELVPLVAAVGARGVEVDESPALGRFAPPAQEAFGREVARAIGFDFEAGRLDPSTHPFCTGIGRRDVRMTWRWQEDDFRPALFGIVHESGHGLYEQGLPESWIGTPIGEAASVGVHESQSRLWENHVARSRAFWTWALPGFRRWFPDAGAGAPDELWATLHVVRPSLIRVEADEVTYNLHVAVRFEIERALFAGELDAAGLPERWSLLYAELLGQRPPDDRQGVLQDIHWALGSFGYFPTYTLGTLAAAQLYEAAGRDVADLEADIAGGDFGRLLTWLRERIHRHGSRYPAAELIARATGGELTPRAFLAHVRRHVATVYGVAT